MIKNNIYIYTFYRFKNLIEIRSIKIKLDKYLKNKLILGTVILANEGVNGTISGTKKDLNEFIYFIKQNLKIRKLSIKISQNKFIPFYRLKIRLKKEIVTIGDKTIKPEKITGKYIDPKNWDKINTDSVSRVFSKNRYDATFHNLFLDFREFHPPLATLNMVTRDGSFSIIKNEKIKLLINQLIFRSYEQVIKNVEMEIDLQLSFKEQIMKDKDPKLINIIETTQEEMQLRFNGSDNYFEKTKKEINEISKKTYARNYINLKLRHRYFVTLFIKGFRNILLDLKKEIKNEILIRKLY